MKIIIKPSFERIYKKLPRSEKDQIDDKIRELFNYYNKDMLFVDLRIRKLSGKDNYFEINALNPGSLLFLFQLLDLNGHELTPH